MILGVNPGRTDGAPIALGRKHVKEHHFEVDQFEYMRPQRRKKKELVWKGVEREVM